ARRAMRATRRHASRRRNAARSTPPRGSLGLCAGRLAGSAAARRRGTTERGALSDGGRKACLAGRAAAGGAMEAQGASGPHWIADRLDVRLAQRRLPRAQIEGLVAALGALHAEPAHSIPS